MKNKDIKVGKMIFRSAEKSLGGRKWLGLLEWKKKNSFSRLLDFNIEYRTTEGENVGE
jgi:hypothetical protein